MMQPALGPSLVALVDDVRAETLSTQTRAAVIRNSLQVLGVARLGLVNPVARDAIRGIAAHERGTHATIVGHGVRRATPAAAAFANALASHADFREDTHSESASHPGVVVVPAVLAALEVAGGPDSGRFVKAVVAGHELIGRLGRSAAMATTRRGFRPASVYPVFGGAVAAAIVLGCTREQQVHALAIAAQGAAGLNHPFSVGTDEWFLAPALAARHAVTSALLAREGVRGSERVLDGPDGVLSSFAGAVVEVDLTPPLEGAYEIERTRLKAALTCGWNQSMVNQLRELAVHAAEVRAVEVRMSPIAAEYPGVGRTSGFGSRSEALLSAPYAAALQISRGSLDHSGYQRLDDPDLIAAARRVTVVADPDLEGYATTVEVTLVTGEVLHSEDGNDKPRFSIDSAERVIETLGRNYASAGLDPTMVEALVAGVEQVVESDNPTALAGVLGS